jgi:glutamate-1-semialdehyde 2,1-aminomutase
MGCATGRWFLRGYDICTASGALLIFDEVISGFRPLRRSSVAVRPDLTCLGEDIGAGCQSAAAGRQIDEAIFRAGPIYQAGTVGNPLAVTPGLWSLELTPGFI